MDFICKKLLIKSSQKILVDIDFTIKESFALVGQSGSGKSLTLKALLGMLPSNLTSTMDISWSYTLKRGENVVMVPQNPFTSLSPLTKIRDNFFIEESLIKTLLHRVGLEVSLKDRFPSELSGGQLQRAIIAIALSHKPKLLLLDEPTTALDSKSKDVILSLINDLRKEYGFKLLFVTHDIKSSKRVCKDIAIIHNGKIVERGAIDEVLQNPENNYTKKLIESDFSNREFRR